MPAQAAAPERALAALRIDASEVATAFDGLIVSAGGCPGYVDLEMTVTPVVSNGSAPTLSGRLEVRARVAKVNEPPVIDVDASASLLFEEEGARLPTLSLGDSDLSEDGTSLCFGTGASGGYVLPPAISPMLPVEQAQKMEVRFTVVGANGEPNLRCGIGCESVGMEEEAGGGVLRGTLQSLNSMLPRCSVSCEDDASLDGAQLSVVLSDLGNCGYFDAATAVLSSLHALDLGGGDRATGQPGLEQVPAPMSVSVMLDLVDYRRADRALRLSIDVNESLPWPGVPVIDVPEDRTVVLDTSAVDVATADRSLAVSSARALFELSGLRRSEAIAVRVLVRAVSPGQILPVAKGQEGPLSLVGSFEEGCPPERAIEWTSCEGGRAHVLDMKGTSKCANAWLTAMAWTPSQNYAGLVRISAELLDAGGVSADVCTNVQ